MGGVSGAAAHSKPANNTLCWSNGGPLSKQDMCLRLHGRLWTHPVPRVAPGSNAHQSEAPKAQAPPSAAGCGCLPGQQVRCQVQVYHPALAAVALLTLASGARPVPHFRQRYSGSWPCGSMLLQKMDSDLAVARRWRWHRNIAHARLLGQPGTMRSSINKCAAGVKRLWQDALG